jgi:hypothetical protein
MQCLNSLYGLWLFTKSVICKIGKCFCGSKSIKIQMTPIWVDSKAGLDDVAKMTAPSILRIE